MEIDFNNDGPLFADAPDEPLADTPAIVPVKRRGKPPGYPKPAGSGRKKIDPHGDYRAAISRLGRPIELMCDLSAGRRVKDRGKWVEPSLDQRLSAARTLLNRIAPELKGVELSGPGGNPIEIDAPDGGLSEIARRLAFVLSAGRDARMANAGPVIEHRDGDERAEADYPSALDERNREGKAYRKAQPPAVTHTHAHQSATTEPIGGLRVVNGGGRWWVQDLSRTPPKLLAGFETEPEAIAHFKALGGAAPASAPMHVSAPAQPVHAHARPMHVPEAPRFANPAEHGFSRSRPAVLRRPDRVWRKSHAA